jgi:hypothetical protein
MLVLRTVAALAATAAFTVPLMAGAGSASADTRHCYTPQVGGIPTYEVCYYLPIEPSQ